MTLLLPASHRSRHRTPIGTVLRPPLRVLPNQRPLRLSGAAVVLGPFARKPVTFRLEVRVDLVMQPLIDGRTVVV